MVCPSCNTNTTGIKLNGKLFCPQCGAILPEPAPTPVVASPVSAPLETKIIEPTEQKTESFEKQIDELGAELKALNEIEQTAKVKEETQKEETNLRALEAAEEITKTLPQIIKSERERIARPKIDGKEVTPEKAATPEPVPVPPVVEVEEPEITETPETEPVKIPEAAEKPQESFEQSHPIETPALPDEDTAELPQIPSEPETPSTDTIAEPAMPADSEVNSEPESENKDTEDVEKVPAEAESNQPQAAEIPQNDKISINFIQAEKGYCVKCKALRDIDNPENVTMKNGHPALKGKCSVCRTTIFKILKGAPKEGFHYHKKNKEKEAPEHHVKALTGFFKDSVASINRDKAKPAKTPRKFSWKIFLSITIPAVLILAFVGLVLYVNFFAINADRAKTKAESTVTFSYEKPSYLPAGYVLSAESKATTEKITYAYKLVTLNTAGKEETTDTFDITISKYDGTKEQAYENEVRSTGKNFGQESVNGTEVYILENKNVVFYNNGVLYEISSSGKISRGELIKIAAGFIK